MQRVGFIVLAGFQVMSVGAPSVFEFSIGRWASRSITCVCCPRLAAPFARPARREKLIIELRDVLCGLPRREAVAVIRP
jgi:hypothetical protein